MAQDALPFGKQDTDKKPRKYPEWFDAVMCYMRF